MQEGGDARGRGGGAEQQRVDGDAERERGLRREQRGDEAPEAVPVGAWGPLR